MKTVLYPSLNKVPLSLIFDALSDPVRLKILKSLLEEGEISCGNCKSSLSKSTMSHHFKILRQTGLIQRREEGRVHFLSIRETEIEKRVPGLLVLLRSLREPL